MKREIILSDTSIQRIKIILENIQKGVKEIQEKGMGELNIYCLGIIEQNDGVGEFILSQDLTKLVSKLDTISPMGQGVENASEKGKE